MAIHDFKEGDLVRIRSFSELCGLEGSRIEDNRLVWVKEFPHTCYNIEMDKYADMVFTIKAISSGGRVDFEERGAGHWTWLVGFIDHAYADDCEIEIPTALIVDMKGGTQQSE